MSKLSKLNALAASVVAGTLGVSTAQAAANPFAASDLAGGYQQLAAHTGGDGAKDAEGKCGEGKCGEGKCGGDKVEGAKAGEGAGGGNAAPAPKVSEGKCGEGKCGDMK